MTDFPVQFIHVGLGKCASTYLQNVWNFDRNYATANSDALVKELRGRAAKLSADPVIINATNQHPGKTLIISSEGLSWGWITGSEGHRAVRALRKLAAESISKSRLSQRILVVIRDPIEWLRALHEQSVKAGGYDSYKTYIARKKELALETLNLAFLVRKHREAGQEVVILSADELRRSPETFWEKYAGSLDVPKPSPEAIKKVDAADFGGNVSLKERVPYLAKLNRHSAGVARCFAGLTKYPTLFKDEQKALHPAASQNWIWINRRIAEFAKFSELKAAAGEVEGASEFQDVFVDAGMVQEIEKNFIDCLDGEGTIDPSLIDQYRRSLQDNLRSD